MTRYKLRFSVIILVLKDVKNLHACLDSLLVGDPGAADFEVVVVANGTAPEQLATLPADSRLRVIPVPANLGFGVGCNLGSRYAVGEYLVFLNDDTIVEPGWLEALAESTTHGSDIGAVSSRLLEWNGELQEAGGVVWRNGRTDRVRDGASEEREVDYGSACGLLVTRDAWNAVGGFDESFYPAYYEDVDLCFSLRKAGYRIVFQPKSVVRHQGSQSLAVELRDFAAIRNGQRFVEKWQAVLNKREPFPGDARLKARIAELVQDPPQPVSSANEPRHTVMESAEPESSEVNEMAATAMLREIAFKDEFIAMELDRLNGELAKFQKAHRVIQRIPVVRGLWARLSSRA